MDNWQDPLLESDDLQQLLDKVKVPDELFVPRVHVLLPLLRAVLSASCVATISLRRLKRELTVIKQIGVFLGIKP
jgi:hypothetical protein